MGQSSRGNLELVHDALPRDEEYFPAKVKPEVVQVEGWTAVLPEFKLRDYLP